MFRQERVPSFINKANYNLQQTINVSNVATDYNFLLLKSNQSVEKCSRILTMLWPELESSLKGEE